MNVFLPLQFKIKIAVNIRYERSSLIVVIGLKSELLVPSKLCLN